MKSIVARAAFLAAVLGFSLSSANAALIINGTFSGSDFPSGPVGTFSGSFSAVLDDAAYTGSGVENLEDLAILTSLILTPNPLGTTTFNTSNVGMDLILNDGTITSLLLGGLPDVSNQGADTDDFLVSFSGGLVSAVFYTIADEPGIPRANTESGSFSSRESSVPAPASILLTGLGLVALGFSRRNVR